MLLARGDLTLDLGIGRRHRPLGPITFDIDAPRQAVYDLIAGPYLGATPRAMSDKLSVIERGQDMVLADHRTQAGPFTTSTVEVVAFDEPERIRFRLVRGPVPYVVEAFDLEERGRAGTRLIYSGEIAADLWTLGSWWADVVGRRWESAVTASIGEVRSEAERRSASARRRGQR